MSFTPAWSAPAPPIGRSSVPAKERSRYWSTLPAPLALHILAAAPETERLQARDSSGALGFNWGIDPATPQQIRTAQIGLLRRPALLDHDALADSLVDRRTVYHFYLKSAWIVLEMPE